MEEAKYSFNLKFRKEGFECQLTMRADTGLAAELLETGFKAVSWLQAHGAVPGNGSGSIAHSNSKADDLFSISSMGAAPVCPVCHQADQLEQISFEREGKPRKAWKCQRCSKWLPNGK